MELRKKYVMRLDGRDTEATLVRDSGGQVWVETPSGERIDDAVVIDHGRTVSLRRHGKMFVVDLTPRDAKRLRALVNGKGGLVELLDELGAAAAEQAGAGASVRELRAEMPGLVLDVKCAKGDHLEAGDPAIVLEAMKMQNELSSPGVGIVEEIYVEPGQSVESGALLLRLAPEESSGEEAEEDDA